MLSKNCATASALTNGLHLNDSKLGGREIKDFLVLGKNKQINWQKDKTEERRGEGEY